MGEDRNLGAKEPRNLEVGGELCHAKTVGLTWGINVRVATSSSTLCSGFHSYQTDQMASVCLKNHCIQASLMTNLQHGVPRASGVQPATDQDWRKEQQKIKDYKGLVDSLNGRVCRPSQYPC